MQYKPRECWFNLVLTMEANASLLFTGRVTSGFPSSLSEKNVNYASFKAIFVMGQHIWSYIVDIDFMKIQISYQNGNGGLT